MFSFNYKLRSLGAGESIECIVDGAPAIELPATGDDNWHRMTVYIPDSTHEHEVTWRSSKSVIGEVGSGVSIDFVQLEQ